MYLRIMLLPNTIIAIGIADITASTHIPPPIKPPPEMIILKIMFENIVGEYIYEKFHLSFIGPRPLE